ncbi:MAG: hypothetical protein CSA15_00040 [Candidatus Delongbacteria bacterium]|nr:MAG: hypothetical protein CSA15_00040 [Candidatus Delongbacteria bacterium]
MKARLLIYLLGVLIVISGCKSNKETLIKIENKLDSEIYIELWGCPAEGYQNNKAGAFDEIIDSDSSFIIELHNNDIYKKTHDISPVYDLAEYEGFEILIYRPLDQETVIYSDTPKDTIYFERVDLNYLIDKHPKLIIVE